MRQLSVRRAQDEAIAVDFSKTLQHNFANPYPHIQLIKLNLIFSVLEICVAGFLQSMFADCLVV